MSGRMIKYGALALVALTVGYGLYEAHPLMAGPSLRVGGPAAGALITDTLYTVHGRAENATRVTVNGQPVVTDLSGTFTEELVTPHGFSTILVEAENRLGQRTERRIDIVGRPEQAVPVELGMANSE